MAQDYSATATLTVASAAGLTDGVTWISTAVSNAVTKYDDVLLWVKLKANLSCTANAVCGVRVFSDSELNVAGISSSSSIGNDYVRNLPLLDYVAMGTSATGSATSMIGPISMAARLGAVPQTWGVAIQNACGQALENSAGANAVVLYQGVKLASS